jgi:hypothetical protein
MENASIADCSAQDGAMRPFRQTGCVLLLLLAVALPVYANNPPQPDGLFSALLVLPAVILGARLACVTPRPRKLITKIIVGVVVFVVATVFLATGTAVGALAALCVLVYAIVKAIHIAQQGSGKKRFLIAAAVGVFAAFAFADYYASIMTAYPSAATFELSAVAHLRSLYAAELEYKLREQRVGTMKDLENARLSNDFSGGRVIRGYRFGEFVDQARKDFLFYAIPAEELTPGRSQLNVVPGASLIKSIFGPRVDQQTGVRSFSVDSTGVFRSAIRKNAGSVTEEEARQWAPLPGGRVEDNY